MEKRFFTFPDRETYGSLCGNLRFPHEKRKVPVQET